MQASYLRNEGGVVRLESARSTAPTSWRHGSARTVGEATSGGAGKDWKEGKIDRGDRAEAERQVSDGETVPRNRAFHLGWPSVALRHVTLTFDNSRITEEDMWLAFLSLFHNRGQQRKHSRSEYWNLAGSLECVHVHTHVLLHRHTCVNVC